MSKITITYMSGAGNLFSVIDDRSGYFDDEFLQNFARKITSKKRLALFDTEGLMVLRQSKENDFECLFFNPDGSSGMMCGNGGRAIARFFHQKVDNSKNNLNFLMAGDVYEANFQDDFIDLSMPMIKEYKKVKLNINEKEYMLDYIFNGSDHCVINVELLNTGISSIDIDTYGKKIRSNEVFEDRGSNANFFEINNNIVYLRTYERGVEKETGACGTGAIATAYSTVKNNLLDYPVKLIPTSKELLIVDIDKDNNKMHLIGPAIILEEDEIEI